MFRGIRILTFALLLTLLAACGTTGKEFKEAYFAKVVNGTTTQTEILKMFGEPYQKGVENGNPVWVYEYNKYKLVGKDISRDMYIVFDEKGVVKSHQLMSN